jgi:hypothetical protein
MPFSEADKVEVKRKAGFRCCRCEQIGVEVHHILPEKDGGTDDIGNAAPLCPNCHNYFGDNPIKRKEITQMRDWWYGVAKIKYPTEEIGLGKLDEINEKLGEVQKGLSDVGELKTMLRPLLDTLVENITSSNASTLATTIVDSIALKPGCPVSEYRRFICGKCGAVIMEWHDNCPSCGTRVRKIY